MSRTVVLIDDDQIIRDTWDEKARERGVLLVAFSNLAGFLKDEHLFSREVEIYLDSYIDGEDLEEQVLKLNGLGFNNLYVLESVSRKIDTKSFEGTKALFTKSTPF